jgi:hypothetical protein
MRDANITKKDGGQMERPANLSPKRVWLPEGECERLNRSEFEAMRCLLGAVSYMAHAKDDLQKRLELVPHGRRWMSMLLGGVKAISDDLIGTMPRGQCKQIRNTMSDMEMRMVPKATPMSQNVIFDKDVAKALVDAAMERCKGCPKGPEEGVKCPLYTVFESFMPLENYDNGLLCPYSMLEWED